MIDRESDSREWLSVNNADTVSHEAR
jgi:hypothetical protein